MGEISGTWAELCSLVARYKASKKECNFTTVTIDLGSKSNLLWLKEDPDDYDTSTLLQLHNTTSLWLSGKEVVSLNKDLLARMKLAFKLPKLNDVSDDSQKLHFHETRNKVNKVHRDIEGQIRTILNDPQYLWTSLDEQTVFLIMDKLQYSGTLIEQEFGQFIVPLLLGGLVNNHLADQLRKCSAAQPKRIPISAKADFQLPQSHCFCYDPLGMNFITLEDLFRGRDIPDKKRISSKDMRNFEALFANLLNPAQNTGNDVSDDVSESNTAGECRKADNSDASNENTMSEDGADLRRGRSRSRGRPKGSDKSKSKGRSKSTGRSKSRGKEKEKEPREKSRGRATTQQSNARRRHVTDETSEDESEQEVVEERRDRARVARSASRGREANRTTTQGNTERRGRSRGRAPEEVVASGEETSEQEARRQNRGRATSQGTATTTTQNLRRGRSRGRVAEDGVNTTSGEDKSEQEPMEERRESSGRSMSRGSETNTTQETNLRRGRGRGRQETVNSTSGEQEAGATTNRTMNENNEERGRGSMNEDVSARSEQEAQRAKRTREEVEVVNCGAVEDEDGEGNADEELDLNMPPEDTEMDTTNTNGPTPSTAFVPPATVAPVPHVPAANPGLPPAKHRRKSTPVRLGTIAESTMESSDYGLYGVALREKANINASSADDSPELDLNL